jgi:Carbohydrate family 9 binding domain-like
MHKAWIALAFSACARRSDPSWSQLPANHVSGDSTVNGEPAAISKISGITIDGKLDEPAWANATVLGPFVQPGTGGEDNTSPVAGFARVGWDENKLYFGFVVRDRTPVSPFNQDDKDPHLWEKSSAIEIMLQPGDPGDNKEYYEMQIDTHNAVFDTHWDDYNTPIAGNNESKTFGHMDWSGHIERAAYVANDAYYSIEAAIPWSAFVKGRTAIPPKSGDVWRLDLYSFRDGQSKALAWSPILGLGNFHKTARFGRITFR